MLDYLENSLFDDIEALEDSETIYEESQAKSAISKELSGVYDTSYAILGNGHMRRLQPEGYGPDGD